MHLGSVKKAERNQQRKLAYLPPVWPLIAIIAIVVVVALLTNH